jgi:hypothetical protein
MSIFKYSIERPFFSSLSEDGEMSFASLFKQGGYRPSGKCDWFKLLTIALPLTLLSACALAFVLAKLFVWGFYLFISQ